MDSISQKKLHVLLLEDNEGDSRLVEEALVDQKVPVQLTVVRDGLDALDYLFQRGVYVKALRPNLIMLDLNLPGKDGREVLAEIKKNTALRMIPVVVLTSSLAERDITMAYEMNANCYVAKPLDYDRFCKVIGAIFSFWFQMVILPGASEPRLSAGWTS